MAAAMVEHVSQGLLLFVTFWAAHIRNPFPGSLSHCSSWLEVQSCLQGESVIPEGSVIAGGNPVIACGVGCHAGHGSPLVAGLGQALGVCLMDI